LSDLNPVGPERLVIEPCHRTCGATKVGARAWQDGETRSDGGVLWTTHNRCIYMF
jgi:hypothetical protein